MLSSLRDKYNKNKRREHMTLRESQESDHRANVFHDLPEIPLYMIPHPLPPAPVSLEEHQDVGVPEPEDLNVSTTSTLDNSAR